MKDCYHRQWINFLNSISASQPFKKPGFPQADLHEMVNQCDYPVCQPYSWNQNRRPHSRGSRQIHLPRFHYLHELELWLRDLSKNRQSHRRHVQFDQESVGKQIPDWKHQNAHLQSIRSPHIALRQWNLDHLHETETPLELFPSAMPQAHPLRQVAKPHH